MKTSKKVFVTAVVVLAILLILTTPAMADRYFVCDGAQECRINIAARTPHVYPAGEPFFIFHASGDDPPTNVPIAAGHMGFALEVDGVFAVPDWGVRSSWWSDSGEHYVFSNAAFNFPDGLPAGKHTFIGHWYAPCAATGSVCENPMDPVEYWTVKLNVNFQEP